MKGVTESGAKREEGIARHCEKRETNGDVVFHCGRVTFKTRELFAEGGCIQMSCSGCGDDEGE